MSESQFLKSRVSASMKQRVQEAAREELVTESIWLRQVVTVALQVSEAGSTASAATSSAVEVTPAKLREAETRDVRLYVRLRSDDRLLLAARAEARGMRPATYLSVLARAHLRNLAPLPKDELLALKQSVAELSATGRNLNQIAHAANQNKQILGPGPHEFEGMLKVATALRDYFKGLLRANLASWESGEREDPRR